MVETSKKYAFKGSKVGGAKNVTGDGSQYIISDWEEEYDDDNVFDPKTGVFKAPITGKYLFVCNVFIKQLKPEHTRLQLVLIGMNPFDSGRGFIGNPSGLQASGSLCMNFSVISKIKANTSVDYRVIVSCGKKEVDVLTASFSGYAIEVNE